MRNIISSQLEFGQVDIANIVIDVTSRDDIPLILLGLQHIYTTEPLKEAVFKILQEVIPYKTPPMSTYLSPVKFNIRRQKWPYIAKNLKYNP